MRHRQGGRKLGRTTSHKEAMLRNLVTAFLKHEKIVTTDIKAKELRRVAEKMITLGKRGGLHARRQALAVIRERDVVKKLFEELSARYGDREGGYTRIVKTGYRAGDNAPLSVIELIPKPGETIEKKKTSSAKE
jgi:large subunit ribosomal protein L17